MTENNETWRFCPSKKCYFCNRDISKIARKNGDYVTGCPVCHNSFVS